jgi:hypothetical protein
VQLNENVSPPGLALQANIPQDSIGEGQLPVCVQRNENVSSPGLALQANISQELSSLSLVKLCSICSMYLPLSTFSNSQHRHKFWKCISCVTKIAAAGATGCSLVRDHCMSNGLVDGKLHQAPGRKVQDQAIQCDPSFVLRYNMNKIKLQFGIVSLSTIFLNSN